MSRVRVFAQTRRVLTSWGTRWLDPWAFDGPAFNLISRAPTEMKPACFVFTRGRGDEIARRTHRSFISRDCSKKRGRVGSKNYSTFPTTFGRWRKFSKSRKWKLLRVSTISLWFLRRNKSVVSSDTVGLSVFRNFVLVPCWTFIKFPFDFL